MSILLELMFIILDYDDLLTMSETASKFQTNFFWNLAINTTQFLRNASTYNTVNDETW